MGVDGPIIPRLVAGQRGGGALKPGCDCTGRSARRSSAPGATAFPVSRHGAEHGQHAGGGSVHHHPAAHVGPRRSAVVAGLCHDPSPHDCDGLGSLGARCSGVLVLGSGGRALAISSFRFCGFARFQILTGQRKRGAAARQTPRELNQSGVKVSPTFRASFVPWASPGHEARDARRS